MELVPTVLCCIWVMQIWLMEWQKVAFDFSTAVDAVALEAAAMELPPNFSGAGPIPVGDESGFEKAAKEDRF